MAKKPSQTHDVDSGMDVSEHEQTYRNFLSVVKWSIIGIAVVVVALYCFIEADQPLLGTLLLLALPVGGVAAAVMRERTFN